jgi:tRNA-dihydrouridine synthase A
MLLARVDAEIFGDGHPVPPLRGIIAAMADYAEEELRGGARLNQITRHMLGLANGRAGARQFRQILSVDAVKPGAGPDLLLRALAAVEDQSVSSSELLVTA